MFKKQHKIIFLFSLVIIALFFIFFQAQKNTVLPGSIAIEENSVIPIVPVAAIVSKISSTIIAGDTTINLVSHQGQSLYEALVLAKENKLITFSGKNYPGIGFFMTDIGTLHSGNGKDLMYYVNGEEATVGISSYIVNNNDVIVWKLE